MIPKSIYLQIILLNCEISDFSTQEYEYLLQSDNVRAIKKAIYLSRLGVVISVQSLVDN